MTQELLVHHSAQLLDKHFDLSVPEESLCSKEIPDLEQLKTALSRVISSMLDREFSRLLNVIYRIDIDENAFQEAISTQNPADSLADLVIKRELQKVKTRIKYSTL